MSDEFFVKALDKKYEGLRGKALLRAPVSALSGVTDAHAELLEQSLKIRTIGDLANNRFVVAAQTLLRLDGTEGATPAVASSPGGDIQELVSVFYKELATKIKDRLADQFGASELLPYQQDGNGDFPYLHSMTNGMNSNTYSFINRTIQYNSADTAFQNSTSAFATQRYYDIYKKLAYQLSNAEQGQISTATTNATTKGNTMVQNWKDKVGPITAAQKEKMPNSEFVTYTDADYVSWLFRTKFKAEDAKEVTFQQISSSEDASKLFPNTPSSASTVLPDFLLYANAFSAVAALMDAVGNANSTKGGINDNLKTPANDGAAIDVVMPDGTAQKQPGWRVVQSNAILSSALQGTGDQKGDVTITISASQSSSSTTRVSVNGRAAGIFGLGWFGLAGGGGATYNSFSAEGAGASMEMTLTYKNVTKVDVQPTDFNQSNKTGWFYTEPLKQAHANGTNTSPENASWVFNPPIDAATTDLNTNGNFGYVSTFAISNFPIVKINYTAGDWATFQSEFKEQSSWSVSFFGIPLAGGSQSYKKTEASQNASGQGFSITFEPNPAAVPAADRDKMAYVLAANATWPASNS